MVFQDGKKNDPNQLFKFEDIGDNTFLIRTCHGFVIDVENWETKEGAKVIQYEKNEGKNQQWRMQDPEDLTSSSSDWEGGW